MAENIWVVIANHYKVKVVSYQHPVYREPEHLPNSEKTNGRRRSGSREGDSKRNNVQNPSTRYQYHVIRQFDVVREEDPWTAYQETVPTNQSEDESTAAALPVSNDPELTAIATRVSDYLSKSKSNGHFQQLILVAPKDVVAVLKSALTPELQEHVMMELETELTDADPETLRANLPANV